MLVEISEKDEATQRNRFLEFEDRIILVRAVNEQEAREKGQKFAADYEKASSWKVRKIVDVHEILDAELKDGIEVYSAFISKEWADALLKGGKSPVDEWEKRNPGKDAGQATVQEVIDAWEQRPKET
jgi:hypothetical protein